jgi:hypothetical protein
MMAKVSWRRQRKNDEPAARAAMDCSHVEQFFCAGTMCEREIDVAVRFRRLNDD